MYTDEDKRRFLDALDDNDGRIGAALQASGTKYDSLQSWRRNDPGFLSEFTNIMRLAKLQKYEKIQDAGDAGDTKAMIYTYENDEERILDDVQVQTKAENATPVEVPAAAPSVGAKEMQRKVKARKDYLVKILKGEGKYTAELSIQATICAKLMVRAEILEEEMGRDGYSPIAVEISREGNERQIVSAKETLYRDYLRQTQAALRALGMNTDAKERRTDGPDTFADFLENLNGDAK